MLELPLFDLPSSACGTFSQPLEDRIWRDVNLLEPAQRPAYECLPVVPLMLVPGIHSGTVSIFRLKLSSSLRFGLSLNPIMRAIAGSTLAISRHSP